jgi:hypothetical protein
MDETTYLKCSCPHCDGHIEYPASAAGQTVACPHCGTTEVLPGAVISPVRKKGAPFALIGMVGGGLLAIGMIGALILHQIGVQKSSRNPIVPRSTQSTTAAPEQESPPDPAAPKSPADFKISKIAFERKEGSGLIYAVGTVKNSSAHQRFGVKIELDLLDGGGQRIGTATDYTAVIEPRDDWSFRALINEAKVTSAKFARISEQE